MQQKNEIKKLIILDRDGVINEDSDNYIRSADEWVPIAGSLEAIALLKKNHYRVGVATNQSGIARGYCTLETLNAIHIKMNDMLRELGTSIDKIVYCPHHPNDGCLCRKPSPNMLIEIADAFQIDLSGVPFVGDSLTDIQTARRAGALPVLVRTGKGVRTIKKYKEELNDVSVYDSLYDYVRLLLSPQS